MEQIILNLVPGGVSPVCYVSQYDVGRKIRLHLRNGSDPYVLSGAETVTATIRKASGEELIYDIVTPIEIPLDQNSKLATVLGINNLMHDANGGTEVKFFRMISAS